MRIIIKTFEGREYERDIDQENYEELKEGLKSNKISFIEIGSSLIKSSQIISIDPIGETILKNFRLEQPEFVKIDASDEMKRLWDSLKNKGMFRNFTSYEEFRTAKKY